VPSSRYNVIPFVLDKVIAIQPKSILDIGIGFGKYGVLFREYLDVWKVDQPYHNRSVQIDGVEAFEEYRNPIWDIYDKVYVNDVMGILDELAKTTYDLVFLGDVIEHFSLEDAMKLLSTLRFKKIIIVTPYKVYRQDAVYGNKYEIHKSALTGKELKDMQLHIIGNQQIFFNQ